MASWCADNLWDAKAWNEHKLGLTVSSDEAAKLFDCSLRQLVSWQDCQQMGGLDKTLKHMREAEPEFLMGRCFSLGLNALGTGHSIWVDPTYRTELEALAADARRRGNPREQQHARAVQLFAQGEMQSATIEWEKIMAEHPNDLLAIKFAHDAYFFMGDNRGKRDSVANVIEKWDKSAPCYSYLHGMYAFGLEECGQYPEAERHAQLGLQLQPQDCWSTHALAHCLEMASNFEEGIRFMEGTRTDWTVCSFLACHNFWHTALFYIEKGDYESALSIFDSEITDRGNHSGSMLDMLDAASLLARLEMEGHLGREAGHERWAALLPRVDAHLDDHTLVFNDAHIAMVLGRLADRELIGRHRDSLAKFVGDAMGGDNWRLSRDFGEQICDAIVAFNSEQYDRAFDQLYQVRTQIYRIGGSNAQRDVFTQILINAGIRSGDKCRLQKTLEVIQEREKYKPKSAVAQRLLQRHKETTEH